MKSQDLITSTFTLSQAHQSPSRILVVTAVSAEREAVLRGLDDQIQVDVLVAGVGPVAAATQTAIQLSHKKYDWVVSAGIGGGFAGRAEVGSIVVADEIIAADLGVQTEEGFSSLDELELGVARFPVEQRFITQWAKSLRDAGLTVSVGAALTVSTITGTAFNAEELRRRIPNATVEAMEGFGVATAAHAYGLPTLELRAISNVVGPRDRSTWKVKEALDALTVACSVLLKEPILK